MPIKPEFICELPRYAKLTKLRKYYDSKQYEGRADFFTGMKAGSSEVVPLRERKPCIIYPLPRTATHQVVRFTFGESRFPTIGVDEIDETSAVVNERLNKDEAEQLEKFLARVVDRCEIKPLMRRLMRPGIATGTSCAILSVKNGIFQIKVANAEDVQPTFIDDDVTQGVQAITWAYQYEGTEADAQGKPVAKRYWFRQDVDAKEYIEYVRVEARPGEPVLWTVLKRTEHNLGFCPVLWCRNVEEEDCGDIDGQSLYDDQFNEFDALNLAISQRHRGVNFFGVPQAWETGVDDDDGPEASGRTSSAAEQGYGPDDSLSPHGDQAQRAAVPISPDNKWIYASKDAKVGLLETSGKAFEAATLHVNDIRSRALEAMSVVLVNVSEIMGRTHQGQMSAKFLELAYEPLLALVDEMRHCWWPNGLRALLTMILRMVAALGGKDIWIPGAPKVAEILKRFQVETTAGVVWLQPPLTASWGDYFSPDNAEIGAAVDAANKAAGLVPDEDRSRFVLPYFDRHDTTEALEELEEDLAEKRELEKQNAANELAKLHGLASDVQDKPGSQQPGREEPPGGAPPGGDGPGNVAQQPPQGGAG